jgi:diguanylate cyclase (GGDEF)-like protein
MLYRDGCLITGRDATFRKCVISSHTLLADAEQQHAASGYNYLLVQNDDGMPIGVVSAEEIRSRTSGGTEPERRRWRQMPVEAILSGTVDSSLIVNQHSRVEGGDVPLEAQLDCTAVSHQGSLLALLTDDDLLVSWKTVERSLQQVMDDPVTGLPGRGVFNRHLKAEFERARLCGHSVGVILIDVDHFKSINDRFGHAVGDAALRLVGRTLRSALRTYDLIARFGGDEFAVLCCGCEANEIEIPMQRLKTAVQQLASDPSIPRPVPTLSMGACVCHEPLEVSSPDTVLAHADECLYLAKRAGRNCSYSVELAASSFVSHSG